MSLLARITYLQISQPRSPLTSKRLRKQWVLAQEICETNTSIFHIPQKKHNKSFADKAVVIIDFIFQFSEEEPLSSRWIVFITGTFLQENHLGEKLQIDLDRILSSTARRCLTLAKIILLSINFVYIFKKFILFKFV